MEFVDVRKNIVMEYMETEATIKTRQFEAFIATALDNNDVPSSVIINMIKEEFTIVTMSDEPPVFEKWSTERLVTLILYAIAQDVLDENKLIHYGLRCLIPIYLDIQNIKDKN